MDRLERNGTLIAITAFLAVALFGILARPLLPVDETRYLTVAWEMREGGHWLVPRLNGEIYSHKPPLLFWLINLVWWVTGVSEATARLIGPAFGAGAIAATAGLARRLWPEDPDVGGRAALVLAGSTVFALYAGLTMFDAMLTLATILGIRALVATQRPGAWIELGAALAFGAFAKGPVILVLLVPTAVLAPLWSDEGWRMALARLGKALALGLGLVALWLVPAIITGGAEYRDAVLWTQSAGRVADSFAHGRPWWWFLALMPLVLWPWAWSGRLWRRLGRLDFHHRGVRLALVWAGSTLVIFSLISGKQLHYLLPALPAVALLAARAMPGQRPIGAPAAGLVPLLLGAAFLALWLGFGPEDIVAQVRPDWTLAVVGVLLISLAATVAMLRGLALAALGLGLVALIDLAFLIGPPGRLYDARPIAGEIAPHDDGGIAVLGAYEGEFGFAARLQHPVLEFRELEQAVTWLAATPGGVLIARMDKPHPAGEPELVVDYNAKTLGFWRGAPLPAN